MLRLIRWCAIALALLAPSTLARAETYPDHAIHFVVAFPPGGATDTFFRLISNELGQALGQSIVIDNRGGAGGYIAWQAVAPVAGRRLHRAGRGKRARHQPGAVQEASVRLQPAARLRRGRRDGQHAAGLDRGQQRARQQLQGIRRVVEDRAGPFQFRPRRSRQRVASGAGGHPRRRRHAGGASAVQGRRSGGAGGRRRICLGGRLGPCRSPRASSKASSPRRCSSPARNARRRCRTFRRCPSSATRSPTSTCSSGGACSSRRARRSRSGPSSRRP